MHRILLILISLVVFIENVDAQNRSRSKKKELIRQYTFTALSVADSKSDSIRILSYLVVPNNVLK